MLLERPGELLTREEICRELWPDGTFVDYEHGVNSAINRIREALGDTAGNPRFVETLARRGYRFVAPVERLDAGEDAGRRTPSPFRGGDAASDYWQAADCGEGNGNGGWFSDSGYTGGTSEGLASRGEDVVRAFADHVPGILCWCAGESVGDRGAVFAAAKGE
jgi:hypothetical protein